MQKYTKLLLRLVETLEERNWYYSITHDERFEIDLGNYSYNVSKYDVEQLKQILDDIQQW